MLNINVESCLADIRVWMIPAMKDDGSEYYEYVLLHTNDAIVISGDGEYVLRKKIVK